MYAGAGKGAAGRVGHAPPEMPKETATARARTLKRALGWTAVLTFGLLWQAASHHLTGVTSRARTSSTGTAGASGSSPTSGQGFSFSNEQGVQPITQTTVS